jgi:tryptophan synthase beta chain
MAQDLLMQSTDGHYRTIFHFGRIRFPGVGPMHANLYATGRAQFISITDEQAMQWGLKLSKMEGIIPAIESAFASGRNEIQTRGYCSD